MKLNILRIIIFNILLFKGTHVLARGIGNVVLVEKSAGTSSPKTNPISPKKADEFTRVNTISQVYMPLNAYTEWNYEGGVTARQVFEIHSIHKNNFSYPQNIEKIKIEDILIEFESNVILPETGVEHISIYTCIHNIPYLIMFYGEMRRYYYSINPKTKKWTNYEIKFDKSLLKQNDAHNAPFYIPHPKGVTSDKFEHVELLKSRCYIGHSTINISVYNKILVFMRQPVNFLVPKPQVKETQYLDLKSKSDVNNNSVKYNFSIHSCTLAKRRFDYDLPKSYSNKLVYPNRVDKIMFNDESIYFALDAILPDIPMYYMFIYTCSHDKPILMYLYGGARFYYYAPEPETGHWFNYEVKNSNGLNKKYDSNGALYYSLDPKQYGATSKNFEDENIVKKVCKGDQCIKINTKTNNFIELFLKNPLN